MGTFELRNSGNDQYYFSLKASNGQTILTSEMYTTRQACENGIASVKANAHDDGRYHKKMSTNDKYYFNLKAINGQVIGNSEMYESASGRDGGIASVKSNAPTATINDLT